MMPIRCRRVVRRAFVGSITDLIWFLLILFLLVVILLPSLSRSRELAKRAVCAANERGLGQGMHIYSNDNTEWFPHHYYSANFGGTEDAPEHGVTWVGTMGSHDFLHISQA